MSVGGGKSGAPVDEDDYEDEDVDYDEVQFKICKITISKECNIIKLWQIQEIEKYEWWCN